MPANAPAANDGITVRAAKDSLGFRITDGANNASLVGLGGKRFAQETRDANSYGLLEEILLELRAANKAHGVDTSIL